MLDTTRETLGTTFLNVVEQLTFMFGEPVEAEDIEIGGVHFTRASLDFTGDLAGTLSVAVPSAARAEIAANILGVEAEDVAGEAVLSDALGEMLNVVGGHVVMALAGADADFKLGAPRIEPMGADAPALLADSSESLTFLLDDEPVILHMTQG